MFLVFVGKRIDRSEKATAAAGKKAGMDKEDYEALSKLLNSGIPGMEGLLSGRGFSGMSDEDKRRFLAAVTGSDGKVHSKAAAVLIAAAASGGDPDIANKIVGKMMSGLGDEIDPAMMAALMATTAMVAQGASNEEVNDPFNSREHLRRHCAVVVLVNS